MEEKYIKFLNDIQNIYEDIELNLKKFKKEIKNGEKYYKKQKDKNRFINNKFVINDYINPFFIDIQLEKNIKIYNKLLEKNISQYYNTYKKSDGNFMGLHVGVNLYLKELRNEIEYTDNLFKNSPKFTEKYIFYRAIKTELKYLPKINNENIFLNYTWISKNPFYSFNFTEIGLPYINKIKDIDDKIIIFYIFNVPKNYPFLMLDFDYYISKNRNYDVILLPRNVKYIVKKIDEKNIYNKQMFILHCDIINFERSQLITPLIEYNTEQKDPNKIIINSFEVSS